VEAKRWFTAAHNPDVVEVLIIFISVSQVTPINEAERISVADTMQTKNNSGAVHTHKNKRVGLKWFNYCTAVHTRISGRKSHLKR
jgi:hypothetical protein